MTAILLAFPTGQRVDPVPRQIFTDEMLIAAIEAGYAAPRCRCERNGTLSPECEQRAARISREPGCLGGICHERDN